jgi:hypothetical protein
MPPAKRASSSTTKTATPSAAKKPAAKKPAAKKPAAKSASPAAKATVTTARKSTAKTATQAKSGATRTANSASDGAAKTADAAKTGLMATATATAEALKETAESAKIAAKGTATVASKGAKETKSRAKAANTRARNTDSVTLTREHVQETLDDAASGDEVGDLLHKGARRFENVTRKARKAQPVDRLVRGADRARRAAGVGPAFPIVGYDDLNVGQVQARLKELSEPDQRTVLTYERKNANRKSIVGALEKSLA